MSIRARIHKFVKLVMQYEQETNETHSLQMYRFVKMAKKCGFVATPARRYHSKSSKANKIKIHTAPSKKKSKYKFGATPAGWKTTNGWSYSRSLHVYDKETSRRVAFVSAITHDGSNTLSTMYTQAIQGRLYTSYHFYPDRIMVSYGEEWFTMDATPRNSRRVYPSEVIVRRDGEYPRYRLYKTAQGATLFSNDQDDEAKRRYEALPHKLKQFEWDMAGG